MPASSYASAMHDSSEDDDAEFRNLQFPQEVALQQVSAKTELRREGGPKARNRGCCSVAEIVPFRRCPVCLVGFTFDFVVNGCHVTHQFNQNEVDTACYKRMGHLVGMEGSE